MRNWSIDIFTGLLVILLLFQFWISSLCLHLLFSWVDGSGNYKSTNYVHFLDVRFVAGRAGGVGGTGKVGCHNISTELCSIMVLNSSIQSVHRNIRAEKFLPVAKCCRGLWSVLILPCFSLKYLEIPSPPKLRSDTHAPLFDNWVLLYLELRKRTQ